MKISRILQLSHYAALAAFLGYPTAPAQEGTGRAGLKEIEKAELEAEFYAGKGGYLHGGLGMVAPLNEQQKIGLVGHFVREESGGELFPSLGVEFIQDLGNGYEFEGFSFGYLPVEDQSAWALGVRASRTFEMKNALSVSPFFGPAYAHVRAMDETTSHPVSVGHLMLLGGAEVEKGPLILTLFASHSFFNGETTGLETHVDLEEMTHFAAYENNDGFAENSAGFELDFEITEAVSLGCRYAWIRYEDRTRHSFALTPTVKVSEQWQVFAGVQFLRGDGDDNTLTVTGTSISF